jgi:hypothetical protein
VRAPSGLSPDRVARSAPGLRGRCGGPRSEASRGREPYRAAPTKSARQLLCMPRLSTLEPTTYSLRGGMTAPHTASTSTNADTGGRTTPHAPPGVTPSRTTNGTTSVTARAVTGPGWHIEGQLRRSGSLVRLTKSNPAATLTSTTAATQNAPATLPPQPERRQPPSRRPWARVQAPRTLQRRRQLPHVPRFARPLQPSPVTLTAR